MLVHVKTNTINQLKTKGNNKHLVYQTTNTNSCVRKETLGWLKVYLDSLVKAALLGKIKDAACIDVGEQLFQRSAAKIFMAYDCGTWDILKAYV